MGCFCHKAVTLLEQQASRLAMPGGPVPALPGAARPGMIPPLIPASAPLVSHVVPHVMPLGAAQLPTPGSVAALAVAAAQARGMAVLRALSGWLAARGLPAAPWQPPAEWIGLRLPMPRMDAQAVATISAMVHLRTQVLAQFGLDLLVPAQAQAMTRIVTTMNTRLSKSAILRQLDPSAWTRLAAQNDAIDHVLAAERAGLLQPPPHVLETLTRPGGVPIGQWSPLLAPLRRLAPLIAASMQLGAPVTETTQLAAALRVLAQVKLPPLAAPESMHKLGAALAALTRLRTSLGIDPLRQDPREVVERVYAKQQALLKRLSQTLAMDLEHDAAAATRVLEKLPKLPVSPGSLATPEVVKLAQLAAPLAEVHWNVPASLPAVPVGLATCTLAASLQTSLGIQAVLPAPCGTGCDAALLMRAAAAA